MTYKIKGACQSVIGNVRENNEDNYYFNYHYLPKDNQGDSKINTMDFYSSDNVTLAIFDGMGGESNGELASYLAANTLNKYLGTNELFRWNKYIKLANDTICQNTPKNFRMGSTVAGISFNEANVEICNLGDSKIFGLKNNKLFQLSQDHTDRELKDRLNVGDKKTYSLTQHLGIKEYEMTIVPYIKKIDYDLYDAYLICSDGLTDMVYNKDIETILNLNISPKEKVNKLITLALNNGGRDNTSVMLLELTKSNKREYQIYIYPIIVIVLLLIIIMLIISNKTFKVIKDDYNGALTVGNSYEFKYRGNFNINIDNDNIEYKDNYIIAKNAGTSTITIVDKNNNVLYTKTIKIFPN